MSPQRIIRKKIGELLVERNVITDDDRNTLVELIKKK